MGYHTGQEIPNYSAYAKHFVLQDHMFAPESSWTVPSHLYMVSGWSATCPNLTNAMSCHSDLRFPGENAADHGKTWVPGDGTPRPYIWPWARAGLIDHQTLSFGAYLKFIEDRFLNGERIDPNTDGWPDSRPTVRENAAQLGNLAREFNFNQSPIPPLVLNPWPQS